MIGLGGLMSAGLSFNSVGAGFGANQNRMALANGVTGNESPQQIASLAQSDKASALQSAKAGIGYDVANATWDGHTKNKKDAVAQREFRVQQGWLA